MQATRKAEKTTLGAQCTRANNNNNYNKSVSTKKSPQSTEQMEIATSQDSQTHSLRKKTHRNVIIN